MAQIKQESFFLLKQKKDGINRLIDSKKNQQIIYCV